MRHCEEGALFVIFCSGLNALGAVELLDGHDAHQVVREGHRPEGQAQIRRRLDARRDAEGRADQEAQRALARELDLRELFGKRLGRKRFALRGQDAEPAALRELLENAVGLLFQPCGDLGGRGRLGQTRLRQLEQPEAAEAAEPLGIFLHCLRVKLFLELADGKQRHGEHQSSSGRRSCFCCRIQMFMTSRCGSSLTSRT